VVVVIPGVVLFYKAPTCGDGIRNQDEQGIDCGGVCPKICQMSFLAPEVKWTRFDYVAPGIYNVGAYVVNYNLNSEVKRAKYIFRVYDKEGVEITTREGEMYIPPNRNTLAFEHSIETFRKQVSKVTFEFVPGYEWNKTNKNLPIISKINEDFNSDDVGAYWEVELLNKELFDVDNIKVYAIIYDVSGNVVGLTQSFIDTIPSRKSEKVTFTWNQPKLGVAEKELIIITE
jgi:hypothetical protein